MEYLHLKPQSGMLGDPNGLIYFGGKYHAFYQNFPFAPRGGQMVWGHATSEDLVRWEHKPIALFPTKMGDMNGCWSGSAFEKDGKMHIFYTGIKYHELHPDNVQVCTRGMPECQQMHMISDGLRFDNYDSKWEVIPCQGGERSGNRDPKVWRGEDGNFYMIIGGRAIETARGVQIFRSVDLERWELFCVGMNPDYGLGDWECPDLFCLDGRWVLLTSPTRVGRSICIFVDYDEKNARLEVPSEHQFADCCGDLYAVQSFLDAEGRRTVMGWLRMPKPVEDDTVGTLCLPRVCTVENGRLCFRPHPNVRAAFTEKITAISDANHGVYRVKASLREGEKIVVGGYVLQYENDCLLCDRSDVCDGIEKLMKPVEVLSLQGKCDLELYVSGHAVECFVNDGMYVVGQVVYGMTDLLQGENLVLETLK